MPFSVRTCHSLLFLCVHLFTWHEIAIRHRFASQDSSQHTAAASSAAPNFQDLNSSFRDLYQSVVDSATASADATPEDTAPPVLSLDAMEQMMNNVTQNKLLPSSVDQGMFK